MTDIKPVAKFGGRRLTPEGTNECWGFLLCKAESDPQEGAKLYPESALLQAREEGRREGMREAEKYLCEAIVATQGDRDGYLVCDVADLLRLFNERKAITRAAIKEQSHD